MSGPGSPGVRGPKRGELGLGALLGAAVFWVGWFVYLELVPQHENVVAASAAAVCTLAIIVWRGNRWRFALGCLLGVGLAVGVWFAYYLGVYTSGDTPRFPG